MNEKAKSAGTIVAVVISAFFALWAPSACAKPAPIPNGKLSPEDCVRIALERSPRVSVSLQQTEQARAALGSARSGILPKISSSVGYSKTTSTPGRYNTATATFTKSSSTYGAGAQARLSLVDRGVWARLGAAGEDLRASRYQKTSSDAQVAFEVRSKYYDLVNARKLLEVARETLTLSQDQLTRSESLYSLGSVTKGDVLKAKVMVADSQLGVIGAENRAVFEAARLAALLGLSQEESVEIDETLEESPVLIDSSAVFNAAMNERSDLKEAQHRLKASKLRLSSAGAGRLPSVSLSMGYSAYSSGMPKSAGQYVLGRTTLAGLDVDNNSWDVGIDISIPIFDGFLTRGNIQQARSGAVIAQENLRQVELSARLEINEAILAVREAQERVKASKDGLLSAEEDYKLSKEKYDVGSGTMLELTNSGVGLTKARSSYVDALSAVKVAQALVIKATGKVY